MEETMDMQVQPAAQESEPMDKNVRLMSPTQMLLRRFFRSKLSVLGLVMVISLFLFCFAGPLIYTQSPIEVDKSGKTKYASSSTTYTVDGVEQYKCYIHIRENDVPRPELLFAKYLREHPEAAKEYGELKQKLALCYEDNRQEYMLAKTEFVEKYTRMAEEEGGKI